MTKQPTTVTDFPNKEPGESDQAYARRLAAYISGDNVRSKGDNRDWTGSLPFHLNRENDRG